MPSDSIASLHIGLDSSDSFHLASRHQAWRHYIAGSSWLAEQLLAADDGQSSAVVAFVEVAGCSRLLLDAHVSIRLVNGNPNDLQKSKTLRMRRLTHLLLIHLLGLLSLGI